MGHPGGVTPEDLESMFGGRDRVSDLFGDLFGGRGNGRSRAIPLEAEGRVSVSLREAYQGTRRMVEMPDGRRLEVTIPAGVASGTVLRVPGLRATVEIRPDPDFELVGRDLRSPVPVPLGVALLGGEVDVPTPRGTKVKLRVPPETQNGTRLRLRGLGMPGDPPGDLYAEVRVFLPLPMDDRTRSWAEGLL